MEGTESKWILWAKVCKPMEEGGVVIQDMGEVMKVFHMKFVWRLMSADDL